MRCAANSQKVSTPSSKTREPRRAVGAARRLPKIGIAALALFALITAACQVARAPAPESTRQVRVAKVRRIVVQPALSPAVWAPDGSRIAYSAGKGIWVSDLDGTGRQVAPSDVATALSWSAPLNLLAVIDRGAIRTLRPDGTDPRPIDLPGLAVQLAWAPGSDRLAVVVRRLVEGQPRFELWLTNHDGGFRRLVRDAPAGYAIRDVQWFGDSLYLLYGLASSVNQAIAEAWRVRITYPDRRLIPILAPSTWLRLAPSGRYLAYLSGSEVEEGRGRITVSRLDGTGRFVLTPEEGRYSGLAWSPQGDKLAFAAARDEADANIWIVDADGSGRLSVFSYPLEFSDPNIALSMSWAPDGRHIVFGTNTGSFIGPIWLATLERR